jgi:hypothetical protein
VPSPRIVRRRVRLRWPPRYATRVHESDAPIITQLTARGYRFDSPRRIMAMSLDAFPVPESEIELGEPNREECPHPDAAVIINSAAT